MGTMYYPRTVNKNNLGKVIRMIRKIVEIDQEKCDGCGLCVIACHEGALQLINGKAVLVSDEYCDGLGNCLPECPTNAIRITEREAAGYNEELASKQVVTELPSELRQWPIQLSLINPHVSYLRGADILVAADCTAYAHAAFHEKFMKGRITLIGCPKLDDNQYYAEKIAEILEKNHPQTMKLVRMDVPCCGGIVRAVKDAIRKTGMSIPYSEVTLNSQGQVISEQ
ncbi:MAG: Ferredoxin-2 [Candidatus Dichloromethanomonas elyunquensis]|nr:MAG: Ferredoxin-2 [Candidatus Dichloromethanomonas elyunquensis]